MVNADDLYRINLRACVMSTWTTYRYIHTYIHTHIQTYVSTGDFFVCMIYMGLASAHPNYDSCIEGEIIFDWGRSGGLVSSLAVLATILNIQPIS